MKKKLVLLLVVIGLAGLLAAGCINPRAIIVFKTPPAPYYELPPPRPGPIYVWIEGHWSWKPKHHTYVWISGYWTKKPPGKYWIPGHWKKYQNGWTRVPGYWK